MNLNKLDKETREQIEHNRRLWAAIAKDYGWYTEPFYIQVWVNKQGKATDSVSFVGLAEDIVIEE